MYRIIRGRFKNQTFTQDDVVKELDKHNMLLRLDKSVIQISDADVEVVSDEPVEVDEEEQESQTELPHQETGDSELSN